MDTDLSILLSSPALKKIDFDGSNLTDGIVEKAALLHEFPNLVLKYNVYINHQALV